MRENLTFKNESKVWINLKQVFEGKRHCVHPQNGTPGFSLHFPKQLSYGYLRFEGYGKIPLGR